MNNKITVLFVLVAFQCCRSLSASAQTHCAIEYSYDASGDRIQRQYKCQEPVDPNANYPWNESVLLTNIYPNPTSGVIFGTFSGTVTSAVVSITSMAGILISQQSFNQNIGTFNIDLTAQVPGNYLLTVQALGIVETYTITKI